MGSVTTLDVWGGRGEFMYGVGDCYDFVVFTLKHPKLIGPEYEYEYECK